MPTKLESKTTNSIAETIERAILAVEILTNPRISLATEHVSKILDEATARADLFQALTFRHAKRSCYENAPCGNIEVSLSLLKGMLDLAQTYSFQISEIAGGSHSKKSRHYAGVAMDVDSINGETVSHKNKNVSGFIKKCKELGATEVLGPGSKGHDSHVHAAWPRK